MPDARISARAFEVLGVDRGSVQLRPALQVGDQVQKHLDGGVHQDLFLDGVLVDSQHSR
jgi:hypothetical protein